MVAFAVTETYHRLRAVGNAVEYRVCDVENVDDDCVSRNRGVASKFLEQTVENRKNGRKRNFGDERRKSERADSAVRPYGKFGFLR